MASSSPRRGLAVAELDLRDQELCRRAAEAALAAYAPYSKFSVGAAVRSGNGEIYAGSNLENASYGLGICAEVAAVAQANSARNFDIEAIAVVGYGEEEPKEGGAIVTPCGRCRQIILEAHQVSGRNIRVICCDGTLSKCNVYSITDLLPDGFGPAHLGIDG